MRTFGHNDLSTPIPHRQRTHRASVSDAPQRLVAELMRNNITTIDVANTFLATSYLARHNARFMVDPASPADAHVPVHPAYDMSKILGRQYRRSVHSDWTIRYDTRIFQIPKNTPVPVYPKTAIACIVFLDGSVHAYHHGTEIPLQEVSRV